MTLDGTRTFVGFGFGPIQAGLFVLEAYRSGNFRRIVVGDVLPDLVQAVRENGGQFIVNVAHPDRIESLSVGPVELYDPAVERDRAHLIGAVAKASEVATAVPSTRFYKSDSPGSIHKLLARGLEQRGGEPLVVYAAENHNRAAEILRDAVLGEVKKPQRLRVQEASGFLNTVIGKMSGTVVDPGEVKQRGLRTLTPRSARALLVEVFNRILVSRASLPAGTPFQRGITIFEEKDDLLPFEEAKLYGHNATHALAAYLAAHGGLERMQDLAHAPGAVSFLRAAFLEEAGAGLLSKHAGVDPLFTTEKFTAYADDLLRRMLNPYLGDRVERVSRDPRRKLGWGDRLIGTMRIALAAGVEPRRFALGAAAAAIRLQLDLAEGKVDLSPLLESIWREDDPDAAESDRVRRLVAEAVERLRQHPQCSVFTAGSA